MTERERDTKGNWIDPDDAPEWPDEVWERAQISVGGKVIRAATGTLTMPYLSIAKRDRRKRDRTKTV